MSRPTLGTGADISLPGDDSTLAFIQRGGVAEPDRGCHLPREGWRC